MGLKRYLFILLPLIVVALIAAIVFRQEDSAKPPAVYAQAPSVEPKTDHVIEATPEQMKQILVETVREQAIDLDLETTGKVGFNEDRLTPVLAPYNGRVLEVTGNKGDVVSAGQMLVIIDSPDLVAAINDLSQATSEGDKARIAVDLAETAAERARNLYEHGAVATKELQGTETELAKARQDYRRAQAAVAVVRSRLSLFGKTSNEIAVLEKSMTDRIDRQIVIQAPISGTIVDRKVGPGQYVKSDTPDPLFLISDLSTVWVNADIYEKYLPDIHVGAPVEITVAAYPDRRFPARISAINPTLDPVTRTIHVRCLVANSAGLLKPEMYATIRIGGAAKRNVPVVPSTAVLTQGPDSFVLIEESPGHFRRKPVKSGREIQQYTVVEEGLGPNDRVVTSGVLLLSNLLDTK